jgi:small neutral amino acid transporter SnatA (MarC family)
MFWLTLLLGLVLVLAPWAFGYVDNTIALWTSVILGAVMALVSGYKATARDMANWEYWIAGIAGLLALIAPFVLNFGTERTAIWTVTIIGGITLVVSAYQIVLGPQHTQA